jgi:transposase
VRIYPTDEDILQQDKLPKIDDAVRFKYGLSIMIMIKSWYRMATLKSITVSRTPASKYFAYCLFEGEQDYTGVAIKSEKIIGLDMMSLLDFYVDNAGNSPEYRRIYRESEKRLTKLQRSLSRKPKDRRNREKAKLKVACIHHVCGYVKQDLLLQDQAWEYPHCEINHNRDTNVAINPWNFGKNILAQCGELTSVDMALGNNKSETAVRSRNLVEQAE